MRGLPASAGDEMKIDVVAPGYIGNVEVRRGKRLQLVEIVPADIHLELAVFDLYLVEIVPFPAQYVPAMAAICSAVSGAAAAVAGSFAGAGEGP